MATKQWIRVASNMSLGAYDIIAAEGQIPEPIWPDVTFKEIIKIAFQGRVIRTPDHPVIQRLHGRL
jgi:hypothetical protein